jgi:hypothetical protein
MARKKRIDYGSINLSAVENFQDEITEIRSGAESWLDAILQYCRENDLEIEDIENLISEDIKDKIKNEEIKNKTIKIDENSLEQIWE